MSILVDIMTVPATRRKLIRAVGLFGILGSMGLLVLFALMLFYI